MSSWGPRRLLWQRPADSAQRLSVKKETIFLQEGLTRATDLAELRTEILGAPDAANTDLEDS